MPIAEVHSTTHDDSLCLLYCKLSAEPILKQVQAIVKEYAAKRERDIAEHKETIDRVMTICGSVKDAKKIHIPEYVCFCFGSLRSTKNR